MDFSAVIADLSVVTVGLSALVFQMDLMADYALAEGVGILGALVINSSTAR